MFQMYFEIKYRNAIFVLTTEKEIGSAEVQPNRDK